ncbi:endo-1,4-beta-xylanase [Natronoflexus pectinivorans]|nr:endo-1,4-beta-xylanase [Natronoflexus pectinivorans]
MKSINLLLCMLIGIFIFPISIQAQNYTNWYNNAQERIEELRMDSYGIQIFDKNGEPYTGEVAIRMQKHEFPFGIAFDFSQGAQSMGNVFSTNNVVQAEKDAEIYRTERWGGYLAYAIPVEAGKDYEVTLKFAEIFHGGNNARIFNVRIDGELFLENFDTHAVAGGRDIAVDRSLVVTSSGNQILIELEALVDNVAIKGIVIEEVDGDFALRINCGGSALTTGDGNEYVVEAGFFDPDANTVASNDDWRKATMYKYFNAGVTENSFKWSGVQSQPGPPNYTVFENAVRWTQKVGWELRGHALIWGGNDNHSTPNWVRSLPTPEDIYEACRERVLRDVERYRGIIKEYDVVNEPLTGHADWLRNEVGDRIIWDSFKWARSVDPDAELYINDYNVEYNWGQAEEYRDLIFQMLEEGAPVTGVGMQAHFWDCCRPGINELVRNINIVAEPGLPIKLTEYDFGGNLTQAEQAADYIMVLTIAFSHPSIVGLYHWSLRDGWAWRDRSGFFDEDGRPKLAADTLLYYTKTKWATNFDAVMPANEPLTFNAFHGNYTVEAEFDGVVKVFEVPLLKANADAVFVLNEEDAVVKGPQILETELVGRNSVRLLFDKPIDGNSLRRSNYRFFSPGNIGVEAANVDPDNENAVILSLSSNVPTGQYISVSYFPGSLKALDGSVANAFGPEEIANNASVGTTIIEQSRVRIYPNPATNNLNIAYESSPFRISIFNSMGVLVYSGNSANESYSLDVGSFARGMYVIQLTDQNNQIRVEKFLLK